MKFPALEVTVHGFLITIVRSSALQKNYAGTRKGRDQRVQRLINKKKIFRDGEAVFGSVRRSGAAGTCNTPGHAGEFSVMMCSRDELTAELYNLVYCML